MRRETELTRRDLLRNMGRAGLGWPLGRLLVGRSARAGEVTQQKPRLALEIERALWEKILDAWFPRCLDRSGGGFHEDFSEDWSRGPTGSKFIVFQARMTWTPAAVAGQYPQHRQRFLSYARHGLEFLCRRMWDGEHGGFIERVDPAGRPDPRWLPWKQMYGQAFGIYAAAGAHQATGDREALDLAVKGFRWIDRCAHDEEHGGYFELLTAEGRPVALMSVDKADLARFPIIGRVGQKSMNAHIHVLEALTALGRVWDDPLLKKRLEEVFLIVRDKITRPQGHLAMFSGRDFQPLDERNSFGHQLETAFLLLEAAEVLGLHDRQTPRVARKLVDHSLRWGWDRQHGGFFDEGPPQGPATKRHKVWWVQPEGLNGLLSVDRMLGHKEPRYRETFEQTWAFFRDHFLDHRHGGCFEVLSEAGEPLPEKRKKATPWKAAYHVVRGLLFAVNELGRHDGAAVG